MKWWRKNLDGGVKDEASSTRGSQPLTYATRTPRQAVLQQRKATRRRIQIVRLLREVNASRAGRPDMARGVR